jgi:hypothetical protein
MERAPSFACCPAPGVEQQLDGLACRFDEHAVRARVDGGEVRCTPPAAEVLRGTHQADQWVRREWRAGGLAAQTASRCCSCSLSLDVNKLC